MRILIITQIYLPEMGALANRLYPIVRQLAAAGHEVKVATGMPNYPGGTVFSGYRSRWLMREQLADCEVVRTAYYTVARNRSKVTQLLSYLCFMPAVFLSALRAGKADVVLVTSPPIFPTVPAIILAKLKRARLVLDVRDLWSDELVTYNQNGQKTLPIRLIRWLERFGYKAADLVCTTTRSLVDTVMARGAAKEKTFLLPNGADLELFKPGPADNDVADKFGFGDRFVVMYSGLFGIKHGLEVLLESARILRNRKDIVFFLLGNGARRDALEQFVRENDLENVIISSEQPITDIPKILSRADICFAAVRSEPYPQKLISVKIFEYLACEKPVIGSLDPESESARIVTESGGGVVVRPGDPEAVAEAIVELYGNPELKASMGAAGREYVEESYSRGKWASRFERLISDRFGRSRAEKSASTTGAARVWE